MLAMNNGEEKLLKSAVICLGDNKRMKNNIAEPAQQRARWELIWSDVAKMPTVPAANTKRLNHHFVMAMTLELFLIGFVFKCQMHSSSRLDFHEKLALKWGKCSNSPGTIGLKKKK